MALQLQHRGPDDEGTYTTHSAGLAFRRLSVIDLSGGHQPIGNENGTIQVVLNGEIYNYRELTVELQKAGHLFTTRSDTEVIVHGYEQWGDDVFQHLRGMFGIAILDTKQNRLIVARDRFGIKPVYWALRDGLFLFASEIKSLLAHPAVSSAVDWSAVGEYLSLRYSLGPGTMYEGIQRLSCVTRLVVDSSGVSESVYWQMRYDRPVITSMEEAEEELGNHGNRCRCRVRGDLANSRPTGPSLPPWRRLKKNERRARLDREAFGLDFPPLAIFEGAFGESDHRELALTTHD